MMNDYKKIIDEISKVIGESENIYISSHINPDGDSIGSLMAMGLALEQLNKNVFYLKNDTIPKPFKFLPNIDRIKNYDQVDEGLFIVLDCGSVDRIGHLVKHLEKTNTIINIDHHLDNNKFGDINLVDSSRSSTGEIVFDLIESLGLGIDKDIATHIYTAITMDTGRFMYDKVDDRTHEIVASLIRTGIDKDEINIKLYQNRSISSARLFIEGVSTLETYNEGKVATVKITLDLLEKTKANFEETDGLISFIRDIEMVEVACLLKESKENEIKVSLRSKNTIDVSMICNHFKGGGHKKAAGCTIYEDISTAEKLLLDQIYIAMRG